MLEEQQTQSGADPVLGGTGALTAMPERAVPESEQEAAHSMVPSAAMPPAGTMSDAGMPSASVASISVSPTALEPGVLEPAAPERAASERAAPASAAPERAASERAASQPAALRSRRAPAGAYRDPATWVIALAVFGAYAALSLFRLLQLSPTSWDLGIYTEYVKQYANLKAPVVDIRAAGFNLLGDHFQPIVALIAPFFRVFPSAATLLVAQALLAALSVFAVSQVAREKLGTGPGRAIAIAYGFAWGLQQMVEFDFHEIAFAVALLAFSLSAVVRGRIKAAVWWALPLVFVKEDQGFTVAAIGLYLIFAGLRTKMPDLPDSDGYEPDSDGYEPDSDGYEPDSDGCEPGSDGCEPLVSPDALGARYDRDALAASADSYGQSRVRAGQFLLIWGFAWSFLAIGVIIPHFNPAHHYDYWSDGGVLAPGGHLSVTGLVKQLFHAWPDKLQTIVMLLLPTAFIALRSPLALIAVPSLLLRFMSTDSSFWGTLWHYNATVMPVIFIAAVDALVRIHAAMDADDRAGFASWGSGRRGPRRAILAGAQRYGAAMMLAIAVPLAFQFPLSNLWNAQTYRLSQHVESAEAAMAKVPDGATVQTTLDLLAPLAARTDTFWIGSSGNPRTQYIVFDGRNSDYTPAITNVPAFIAQLYPGNVYTQIFESGDVYVFRRTN
jgi:uncharacterized membrane protein